MRVSVAMCTYQGARHLDEQLASIADQAQPPDELVVCDDGSTDGTLEILRDFAAKHGWMQIIRNTERLGSLKNFQQETELCGGEVICFADQDDVWHPQKLKKLCAALAESPGAGLVFCNAEVVNENLEYSGYSLWQFRRFSRRRQGVSRRGGAFRYVLGQGIASGMAMGFRSKFKDLVLPIEALSHDLWVSILVSATTPDVALVPERLAQWRQHITQQTGSVTVSTFSKQLSESKSHGDSHYIELVEGYQMILNRLIANRETYPCSEEALDALAKKIDHLKARARMRQGKGRLPLVAGEAMRGHYGRYSNGLRSALKDLVL